MTFKELKNGTQIIILKQTDFWGEIEIGDIGIKCTDNDEWIHFSKQNCWRLNRNVTDTDGYFKVFERDLKPEYTILNSEHLFLKARNLMRKNGVNFEKQVIEYTEAEEEIIFDFANRKMMYNKSRKFCKISEKERWV